MRALATTGFALAFLSLIACSEDASNQAPSSPADTTLSETSLTDGLVEETLILDVPETVDDVNLEIPPEVDVQPDPDVTPADTTPDIPQDVATDMSDGSPVDVETDAQEVIEDSLASPDVALEISEDSNTPPADTAQDSQNDSSQDAAPDSLVDATIDAPEGETVDLVEPDTSDMEESEDPFNQLVHFEAVGVGADSIPVVMSQVIQIPEGFESVEAQIAIRGDLDAFPMAFMALLVEQDGTLSQCGDLAGLPQQPNNLLDDIYRVGFPRPENLDTGSVFYPPSAPYDYQAIPCQEAFANKTEVEIGIVVVGMYAPGVGSNQGPGACGGPGCPNDAMVKLRFIPDSNANQPQPCEADEALACVCPDGTYGLQVCEGGLEMGACACEDVGPDPETCSEGEETPCQCPDATPSTMACLSGEWTPCQCADTPSGTCDDPYPFDLGPEASQEVTIALLGTALHEVPWPPFMSACPTSKPPFSVEYHYAMTVTQAGNISVSFEAIPEPWEITQFWLDMLGGCGVPLQCNNSWTPLEGYAEAGTYIIGLTVAPPNEIFIPEQDDWEFSITASWTPGDPPP